MNLEVVKPNISKLLCDVDSPQPDKNRVDSSGKYILWEGCTIIMPLNEQSSDWANLIYSRLKDKEVIKEYVSLLPPSSYHTTLRGVRERYKCQNAKEYN